MGSEGQVREGVSQAKFESTPYQDATWEIVGDFSETPEFAPLSVSVLGETSTKVDPMFQDFGGGVKEEAPTRWHMPVEDGAAKKARDAAAVIEAGKLRVTPEELEALKAEAYERGLAEGKTQGAAAKEQEVKLIQKNLQVVINDIVNQLRENLRGLEKHAVELSVAIGEKLMAGAVEINPEYISKIVQEALTYAGSATIKRIRVSPQDAEFIDIVGLPKHLADIQSGWSFEKDDTIRSGCVVDTSAGELDFRLDKAWERIRDNVLKVVK